MPTVNSVRSFFASLYEDLSSAAKSGNPQWKSRPPDGRIYPDMVKYPAVFLLRGGDAMGPHAQLLKYLRDCRLTGRRKTGGPLVVEAHHLLEERCMDYFGISEAEGLCVGIDDTEHSGCSAELPNHLRRSRKNDPIMFDIDVVYDAHCKMYRDAERASWIPLIRVWLRSLRSRIEARYAAGKVPGATPEDVERVRQFFNKL